MAGNDIGMPHLVSSNLKSVRRITASIDSHVSGVYSSNFAHFLKASPTFVVEITGLACFGRVVVWGRCSGALA